MKLLKKLESAGSNSPSPRVASIYFASPFSTFTSHSYHYCSLTQIYFLLAAMSCSHCEITFDVKARCPRVMSCGHVLCSECLKGLQQHQPSDPTSPSPTTTFTCPHDKVQTRVPSSCPEDAIRALPREREIVKTLEAAHFTPPRTRQCEVCQDDAHPATHRCVDCDEWFCSVVANSHKIQKVSRGHVVEAIDESTTSSAVTAPSNVCWDHNRPIEGYDAVCQRVVCAHCSMFGLHKGHTIVALEEAAEQSLRHLPDSITAGEGLLDSLATFLQNHFSVKQSLADSFEKSNALIRASFSTVRRVRVCV